MYFFNTLTNYSLRALNKRATNVQEAMHLHTLLVLLEALGDQYSRFYLDVTSPRTPVIRKAKRAALLLRGFYELYYTFDLKRADDLKNQRDALRAEIDARLTKTTRRDDLLALCHIRRIADLIVDIEKFQLAMQL